MASFNGMKVTLGDKMQFIIILSLLSRIWVLFDQLLTCIHWCQGEMNITLHAINSAMQVSCCRTNMTITYIIFRVAENMAFTHCGLVTPWFYRSWLSSQCVLPDSILPHIMMQLPTHDITPPISCIEYILYWRTVFHSINCFIPGTPHASWFSKCRIKIQKTPPAQCSACRYFECNYQGCRLWVPVTWQSHVF